MKKRPNPLFDSAAELEWSDHGGDCCGRNHIYDFPTLSCWSPLPTVNERAAFIATTIEDNLGRNLASKPRGKCIEAVLIDRQMEEWRTALFRVGFKKVMSFKNQNSNNTCHVFLLDTTKMKVAGERE